VTVKEAEAGDMIGVSSVRFVERFYLAWLCLLHCLYVISWINSVYDHPVFFNFGHISPCIFNLCHF